jgi:hypothetical protein
MGAQPLSGQLTAVLREIRRSGLVFFEVDSAFLRKEPDKCVHRVHTRLCNFYGKRSRPRKTPPPNVGFGVDLLPSAKHKWHIDNTLDAKITACVFHNGERDFHIHILLLYSSSIRQSYRGFTDFGGICSGIPRLNTASSTRNHFSFFSPRRRAGS